MTDYWIEELGYSVENFSESGNLLEVLARLHDLDAARAAYEACRAKYPKRLLFLCQGLQSRGRKPTQCGPCASSWAFRLAVRPTSPRD